MPIFLFSLIETRSIVLQERTRDNSKEAESFREQLNARSSEYVEEVLSPHFGGIIQLVKETESLSDKAQADYFKQHEGKALVLVEAFTQCWKNELALINGQVLRSFPSLVLGGALLQRALTQFVQYYHRLHKILPANARARLTNIHHIMVEIKKYRTNY